MKKSRVEQSVGIYQSHTFTDKENDPERFSDFAMHTVVLKQSEDYISVFMNLASLLLPFHHIVIPSRDS